MVALVIIGVAILTGHVQQHDLVDLQRAICRRKELVIPPDCNPSLVLGNVAHYDSYVRVSGFVVAPLVGAILGVLALVSELEGRTVRLAWTQSISRAHWFVVKVGVGSLIVSVILVPIAVTLSWWNGA